VAVRWITAFLDTPRTDAGRAGLDFWLQVTGSTLSARRGERQEFATLLPPDGDAYLRVQEVDESVAGCHLDLHVDDVEAARNAAVQAGADVVADHGTLVVFRSPGGMACCLVRHGGERSRPSPLRRPDGRTVLVDQVCIDAPAHAFDAELRFWSALTAWPPRSGARPEFAYLDRPAGMPLRLLFQRLAEARPGQPVTAHLDLASTDREAEAQAHVELGAALERTAEQWITLRDAAGRPYCITARDPGTGRLA
jgi:hypothetical protein